MANDVDVYEVWSVASGSILMAYPSEDEALELVRMNLEALGPDGIRQLVIVSERCGRSKVLWEGDQLVSRLIVDRGCGESARRVS